MQFASLRMLLCIRNQLTVCNHGGQSYMDSVWRGPTKEQATIKSVSSSYLKFNGVPLPAVSASTSSEHANLSFSTLIVSSLMAPYYSH